YISLMTTITLLLSLTTLFRSRRNYVDLGKSSSDDLLFCTGTTTISHISICPIHQRKQIQISRYHLWYYGFRSRCGSYLQYLPDIDRKSTRLNSSHVSISYAVF